MERTGIELSICHGGSVMTKTMGKQLSEYRIPLLFSVSF